MKFLSEEFEYQIIHLFSPRSHDYAKFKYSDKKFLQLESYDEFYKLILNELGAKGWELISLTDNSGIDGEEIKRSRDKLILKRSSRSRFYGSGLGVDQAEVRRLAEREANNNHHGLPRDESTGLE